MHIYKYMTLFIRAYVPAMYDRICTVCHETIHTAVFTNMWVDGIYGLKSKESIDKLKIQFMQILIVFIHSY